MSRNDDTLSDFWAGVLIGLLIFALAWLIGYIFDDSIELNAETAKDICHNLFPNQTTITPSVENGKLICEVPSYDSTTNIIKREAK